MKKTRQILAGLLAVFIAANSAISVNSSIQCRQKTCCCQPQASSDNATGLAKSCCGCEMTVAIPIPVQPAVISFSNTSEIQKFDASDAGFVSGQIIVFEFEINQKIENHAFSPPLDISILSIPLRC